MADTGTLEKLLIKAYEKADYSGDAVSTFESQVNPNEITLAYELEWDAAQGSGTTGSRMNFKKMKPGDMSLVFYIDGTGADGKPPVDVQQKITEFQTVTGIQRQHPPAELSEGGVGHPAGEALCSEECVDCLQALQARRRATARDHHGCIRRQLR